MQKKSFRHVMQSVWEAQLILCCVKGTLTEGLHAAVKQYAKKYPHKMGAWSADSKTHVSHMTAGDFYHSEKSVTMKKAGNVKIEFVDAAGNVKVLKEKLALQAGEVLDGRFYECSCAAYVYRRADRRCPRRAVCCSRYISKPP